MDERGTKLAGGFRDQSRPWSLGRREGWNGGLRHIPGVVLSKAVIAIMWLWRPWQTDMGESGVV